MEETQKRKDSGVFCGLAIRLTFQYLVDRGLGRKASPSRGFLRPKRKGRNMEENTQERLRYFHSFSLIKKGWDSSKDLGQEPKKGKDFLTAISSSIKKPEGLLSHKGKTQTGNQTRSIRRARPPTPRRGGVEKGTKNLKFVYGWKKGRKPAGCALRKS